MMEESYNKFSTSNENIETPAAIAEDISSLAWFGSPPLRSRVAEYLCIPDNIVILKRGKTRCLLPMYSRFGTTGCW